MFSEIINLFSWIFSLPFFTLFCYINPNDKMSTRSKSTRETETESRLSPGEIEILQKQIADREARLQAQAEALRLQQDEFNKQREQSSDINPSDLGAILNSLSQDLANLRNIPTQISNLESRVNDMQKPGSNQSIHTLDTPEHPSIHSDPLEPAPLKLKDAVAPIPFYDGHNLSVFQFCRLCNRALKFISSNQEYLLVQLIINKLQGHAYLAVEGSNIQRLSQLTDRLKSIFGPNKSLDQYRGELANIYMRNNENVLDYIARIKDLRSAILEAEYNLYGTITDLASREIDEFSLENFLNGLPSELLIRVKLLGYTSFDDAIIKVVQTVKTLEVESRRQKVAYPSKTLFVPRADNTARQPTILQRSQTPNSIPASFIKPLIPGQPGPNTPQPSCRYCKRSGHIISECRKLQYRNSQSNQENTKSDPGNNGVHREAIEQGRQKQNTVRFSDPQNPSTSALPA